MSNANNTKCIALGQLLCKRDGSGYAIVKNTEPEGLDGIDTKQSY